jgi:hypothetical protein
VANDPEQLRRLAARGRAESAVARVAS